MITDDERSLMKIILRYAVALLMLSCGTSERVITYTVEYTPVVTERCVYEWQENDGWAFIAWALDIHAGAEALAIQSGYLPHETPEPGTEVLLPLDADFSDAFESRMSAARKVREATECLETGDTISVYTLLLEAIEEDSSWSVPACNIALLLIERDMRDTAREFLQPWAHKYDATLILAGIAWQQGDSEEAIRQVEIALMNTDAPFEAKASAALIYSVTGHLYQASSLWRDILANPEASSSIRLMAARLAILEERRSQQ